MKATTKTNKTTTPPVGVETLETRRLLSGSAAPIIVGSAAVPDGLGVWPDGPVTVGHQVIFRDALTGAQGHLAGDALIYDADTNTVTRAAGQQETNASPTAAVAGNVAVFAGGVTYIESSFGAVPWDDVRLYHADTGQWTDGPTLSQARAQITAATIDDRWIVFAGGDDGLAGFVNAVDVYDAATDTWTVGAPLPSVPYGALAGSAAAGAGSHQAVFAYPTTAYVYDVNANHWSTAPLSQQRTKPRVVSVGGKVLIVGGSYVGRNGKSYPSDAVDVFDPATGTWSASHAPGTIPSSALDAVVGQDVVFADSRTQFVVGTGGTAMRSAYVFDAGTGQWSTVQAPAGTPVPQAAAAVGGRVVFMAIGQSAALVLDVARGQWSTLDVGTATSVPELIPTGTDRPLLVDRSFDQNHLAGAVTTLTPTNLTPPTPLAPADGAAVHDTFRPTFTWSAVPGASTYDLALDGATARPITVSGTSFTPAGDLLGGTHVWSVVAKLPDGSALRGPTATFALPGPHLSATLVAVVIPAGATTASRGSVRLTITNNGDGSLNGPYELVFTAVDDNDPTVQDRLIGARFLPGALAAGQSATVRVPLWFSYLQPGTRYRVRLQVWPGRGRSPRPTLLEIPRKLTVAMRTAGGIVH